MKTKPDLDEDLVRRRLEEVAGVLMDTTTDLSRDGFEVADGPKGLEPPTSGRFFARVLTAAVVAVILCGAAAWSLATSDGPRTGPDPRASQPATVSAPSTTATESTTSESSSTTATESTAPEPSTTAPPGSTTPVGPDGLTDDERAELEAVQDELIAAYPNGSIPGTAGTITGFGINPEARKLEISVAGVDPGVARDVFAQRLPIELIVVIAGGIGEDDGA